MRVASGPLFAGRRNCRLGLRLRQRVLGWRGTRRSRHGLRSCAADAGVLAAGVWGSRHASTRCWRLPARARGRRPRSAPSTTALNPAPRPEADALRTADSTTGGGTTTAGWLGAVGRGGNDDWAFSRHHKSLAGRVQQARFRRNQQVEQFAPLARVEPGRTPRTRAIATRPAGPSARRSTQMVASPRGGK